MTTPRHIPSTSQTLNCVKRQLHPLQSNYVATLRIPRPILYICDCLGKAYACSGSHLSHVVCRLKWFLVLCFWFHPVHCTPLPWGYIRRGTLETALTVKKGEYPITNQWEVNLDLSSCLASTRTSASWSSITCSAVGKMSCPAGGSVCVSAGRSICWVCVYTVSFTKDLCQLQWHLATCCVVWQCHVQLVEECAWFREVDLLSACNAPTVQHTACSYYCNSNSVCCRDTGILFHHRCLSLIWIVTGMYLLFVNFI